MDFHSRRRRRLLQSRLMRFFHMPSSVMGVSNIFLLSNIATYFFFLLIAFLILFFGLFLWYSRDLPTPGKLVKAQLSQSTRIYDRKGVLLYSVYQNQNRVYVTLPHIPKQLQEATIAIEDKNFYSNQGFDILGYLRAIRNIVIFKGISGGSTLTQQLVKNVLLTSERTLPRKIKELVLAVEVDKKFSKDQILEMYLNDVPYGGTNVGVEAAAEAYFGKKVQDLDVAQDAMLAGIPQAPTTYSPYKPERYYLARTNDVLKAMVTNGYISQKQKDDAYNEILNTKFSPENAAGIKAPWYVMYVKELLGKQFGEQMVENGGLQVTTTLDYDIEKKAEEIMPEELDKIKSYHVGNGAAIVADPKTGEILAMVGGKDYFDKENSGNFNAALAHRQPGSSLKPITYAVAFEKGYTPSTLLMDTKTDFPSNDPKNPIYTPVNYDDKYHGPVQVRFALGNSLNLPAVKMLAKVGIKDVMQKGYEMGITNWQPTAENLASVGLSLVLGGRETTLLDEVTAYSVFADQGIKHDPVFVLQVKDSKGDTLYQNKPGAGIPVLSKEVSFLISHILLDNNARSMEFGLNSWLVIPGRTVSVKTGTTDSKRDNWTTGFTSSYVVGVWVGNNDNSPMNPAIASGITGASPIWNRIMSAVLKGKADEQPQKPDNVDALQVDTLGSGLPGDGKPTRSEYFIKGTQPTGPSQIYQKLKISKHQSGKLANQDEINHGDYDTKDFIVFKEDDPVSTDGKNRWQEGIDDWIKTTYSADHPEYYPPKDTSDYKYGDSSSASSQNTPTPQPTATPTPSPTITPTPTP